MYTATTLSEEIFDNHMSVLSSFGLSMKDMDCDLLLLYWIPKLHKCPFKQRFIKGAAKSSTKPLSKVLTSIFTAVKYQETRSSRSGVNIMWILKRLARDFKF